MRRFVPVLVPIAGALLVAALAVAPSAGARASGDGPGVPDAGRAPGAAASVHPASAPSGYSQTGIDVSDNNDPINWSSVASSGTDFAYVKATEGTTYTNSNYASDIAAARAHGLYVGAYGFARPDSNNPVAQADRLAAVADYHNDGRTLRPFVDLEFGSTVGEPNCYGLSQSQLVSWITSYLDELTKKIGILPMIYTAEGWWDPCTGGSSKFSSYPLDVASYGGSSPTMPHGWNSFTLWQYTDDSGNPGSSSSVDGDVFNGSAADLQVYADSGATAGSAFVRTDTDWHGALRGSDTHTHQLVYTPSKHWFDQDLGGGVVGNQAMVLNDGRYDIFALGPSGQLYQDTDTGSGWGGYHPAGSAVFAKGAGVTAIYAGGIYRVFGEGPGGALYQVFYSDGSWHSQNLGGSIIGTPGVTAVNGRYDVFALSPSGHLYQDTDSGSGWGGLHPESDAVFGTGAGAGVTALYAGGDYRVFGAGSSGTVYQVYFSGGQWHSQGLGGDIVATPGVTYRAGRYDLFGTSPSGTIYQDTDTGSGWGGWNYVYHAL